MMFSLRGTAVPIHIQNAVNFVGSGVSTLPWGTTFFTIASQIEGTLQWVLKSKSSLNMPIPGNGEKSIIIKGRNVYLGYQVQELALLEMVGFIISFIAQ